MPAARTPRSHVRTWPQRFVLGTGVLLVGVTLLSAVAAAYLGLRFGQIDRVEDIDIAAAPPGEPANYLLVGTDSREGLDLDDPDIAGFTGDGQDGCNCTDTIMVLRVDPGEGTARILSFPRDLWVPIAGQATTGRINTAHAHGEQTLIDTIEDTFGLPINHYVEIDFVGFERLVDAVGGVPMWFDAPVRDTHSGLSIPEAGCQVLDGQEARRYVRSRYLDYQDQDGDWQRDPSADLGRITRQQIFVRSAVSMAISKGLTSPVTLNELVSAGVANVRLDEALDAGDLLDLGRQFARFDSDELVGYSIPSEPSETSAGAKIERPSLREAQPILNIFRGLPPDEVAPQAIDLTVLNGSGQAGQARDAASALGRIGFVVEGVATSPDRPLLRTTVRYGDGGEAAARRVARHVTGGAALQYDGDVAAGAAVLITGVDFTTIHDQPAPSGSSEDLLITTSTTLAAGTVPEGPPATDPTTTIPEPEGYGTGEPPPGVHCG